jgi:hypothetical protein
VSIVAGRLVRLYTNRFRNVSTYKNFGSCGKIYISILESGVGVVSIVAGRLVRLDTIPIRNVSTYKNFHSCEKSSSFTQGWGGDGEYSQTLHKPFPKYKLKFTPLAEKSISRTLSRGGR